MALLSHLDHYVWEFRQRVSPGGYQLVSDAEGRRFLAPKDVEGIVRRREVAVFQEPTLLRDLPRPDDSDVKLLDFASRYGLLRPVRLGSDERESLDDWRQELTDLHDARAWLNQARDGVDADFRTRVEAVALVSGLDESVIIGLHALEGDPGDQQRSDLSGILNQRLADVSVKIRWSGKAQAFTWKLAVPNLLTALWLRLLWESSAVVQKRLCECGCGTPVDPNRNGTKRYLNPRHKLKAQDQKRKAARAAKRVALTRQARPRTAARRSRRRAKR